MQDIELYRQLPGLNTPRAVTRVELKITEQRDEVWAGHAESTRCQEIFRSISARCEMR